MVNNILVSGGSRGLGLHIVRHLLASGHRVCSFARKATDPVRALQAEHPKAFLFRELDAADHPEIESLIAEMADAWGRVDGLVNNAAIGQDHLLAHVPVRVVENIVAVNILAPILLTRKVVKTMLLQETGGRIVNISSICGTKGYTGLTVYSASKGAMDAFTRSLAVEVGSRGILVNSIAPGFFESEMSAVLSPEQLSTIKRRTPTGSLTSPDQLLPVLDMLLFSDTNITGHTIMVDGGVTA